jgi:hypothetical protein
MAATLNLPLLIIDLAWFLFILKHLREATPVKSECSNTLQVHCILIQVVGATLISSAFRHF